MAEEAPRPRIDHQEVLRIDGVLTNEKEFGNAVPDGGYGWIIMAATSYLKYTIPSIMIAFGVFIMFNTLETSDHVDNFKLWDNAMVHASLFFIIAAVMSDPVCRIVVFHSTWPRLVALCGLCLTSAGVLMFWLATANPHLFHKFFYTMSGIFSGIGASLTLIQSEILVSQYFRLKLDKVNTLLWVMEVFGFVTIPVMLGHFINEHGLPHVIIWYHLIVLVGVFPCVLFKKPAYLKRFVRVRNRLNSGDEEDIFSKNSTELKTARSTATTEIFEDDPGPSINVPPDPKTHWEHFSDDEEEDDITPKLPQEIEPPKDLFTELHLNNNTTYSFDNGHVASANDDGNIFMPIQRQSEDNFRFFLDPSFYRHLLMLVVVSASKFVMFGLYPSILYFGVTYLHKKSVSTVIGYVFCSCFFLAGLVKFVKVNSVNRLFFITVISWVAGIGCFMISDTMTLTGKIMGGMFLAITIFTEDYLSEPYIRPAKLRTEPNRMYLILSWISGLVLTFFLLFDVNYIHIFRLVGFLQLLNGTVWFSNYIYKKIKNEY